MPRITTEERKRAHISSSNRQDNHCRKCQQDKPLSAFYISNGRVRSVCKECCRAWQQAHYQRGGRERQQARHQRNPQARKEALLKMAYGIGLAEYTQMLKRQSGKCAICGNPPQGSHYNILVVDHDHQASKIRGLLCNECNIGLGRFKDSVDLLRQAIKYLEQA